VCAATCAARVARVTAEAARRWIKRTKFRVVRGRVQKGC
jgi:hypothetical protein